MFLDMIWLVCAPVSNASEVKTDVTQPQYNLSLRFCATSTAGVYGKINESKLCLTLRLNHPKQKPTGIIIFKSPTMPSMPWPLVHASIISWLPMI